MPPKDSFLLTFTSIVPSHIVPWFFHVSKNIYTPTILEPLAFCTPAPLFILYSAHSITEPSLTCKKQHQAQCKKVCICGQEVRHVQRESSLERLRDVYIVVIVLAV